MAAWRHFVNFCYVSLTHGYLAHILSQYFYLLATACWGLWDYVLLVIYLFIYVLVRKLFFKIFTAYSFPPISLILSRNHL